MEPLLDSGMTIGARLAAFMIISMLPILGLESPRMQRSPRYIGMELGDFLLWEMEGKIMQKFETWKVYHYYLRGNIDTVNWAPAVWSSKSIPRQSFHSWLVVLDRNPTRDRLISWGLQVSHLCLL